MASGERWTSRPGGRRLPGRRALALALAFIFAGVGVRLAGEASAGTGEAVGGFVRFHVVAHSDGPEDQAVKLYVRDRLLPRMAAIADRHGGWGQTPWPRYLPDLEGEASAALQEAGFPYGARATWGLEPLGAGHRVQLDLPGDLHPTLRIILGAGAGANWWCVLFPPLCFVDGGEGLFVARPVPGQGLPGATGAGGGAAAGEGIAAAGSAADSTWRFGLRMLAALAGPEDEEGLLSWEQAPHRKAAGGE